MMNMKMMTPKAMTIVLTIWCTVTTMMINKQTVLATSLTREGRGNDPDPALPTRAPPSRPGPRPLDPGPALSTRVSPLDPRVVHGSLFLDPTRPDPTRRNVDPTRPDPRLPTKSLTRPDPTRGPTLPPNVHSLIEYLLINYLIIIY